MHPLDAQLTLSHYRLLFALNDKDEIVYYIKQAIKRTLSKRELATIIKSNEYKRLPQDTKNKLVNDNMLQITDFVKNPIMIRNNNYEVLSEKILQRLIVEDLEFFMSELGDGFSFIGSEYKIKVDDKYNYIDLLLFNYEYNCFVVIELKVTELKKEHIGQIQVYMNYIDNNLKKVYQNKTIGIIICRQDSRYVIKYCSDKRIISREYNLL